MSPRSKPFTWSYSGLKNYEACAFRHQQVDRLKRFKDDKGEVLIWGMQLHDALANAINKGDSLPPEMQQYQRYVDIAMRFSKGGTIKAEMDLAIDRSFQPTGWFDDNVWLRAKVDVNILHEPEKFAVMLDWKAGKILEDSVQLGISSTMLMCHHKSIDFVKAVFVWLGKDALTEETWQRSDLKPLWNSILPRVKAMENSYNTGEYAKNPSGLCKKYCPVTTCEFHGKGSH
jgi:hypothetical protein